MNSRKGVGKPINGAANSLNKGKAVAESSDPIIDNLGHGLEDITLDSTKDGDWEVYTKKAKNKGRNSATKTWANQNPNPKAWGNPDTAQKLGMRTNDARLENVPGNFSQAAMAGRGNTRPVAPTYGAPLPLAHGWKWSSRPGSTQYGSGSNPNPAPIEDDVNDDVEAEDDESDIDVSSDEYEDDSDCSEKSHETRKNSKCFKKFFQTLEGLSLEELSEPERQWHCPACHGGPGAIDWYRGLQPLMTHAKTKAGKKMKLHRELAELLDEELRMRGTSVVPAGEAFGKWNAGQEKDHEIIWPPMVIIMNTQLERDDNDKWIGMGNQELMDYFRTYAVAKARHSYGPQGHRGLSVLIFESTAPGYLEAERLHKHFLEQGTDREAWERPRPNLFYPGGKRQLYGFMATKQDLDAFNRHCHGKTKLKFELRSYQEMVVHQVKQMNEDNQQLIWLKNKVAKEQRHSKAIQEVFSVVSEKLRKTMVENRIVRERTKKQHEQNKEEMDFQEEFFKDQIQIIHEARDAKENKFEMLQQKEREKVKQSNLSTTSTEDELRRAEEVERFIKSQEKEMEEFVGLREKLMKAQEERKVAMKLRHWEEEVEIEKEFDVELNDLMKKYMPDDDDADADAAVA